MMSQPESVREQATSSLASPQDDQQEIPGAAARVVSRPVFMPDTFTGVNREWSDWLEQFEMVAVVNM